MTCGMCPHLRSMTTYPFFYTPLSRVHIHARQYARSVLTNAKYLSKYSHHVATNSVPLGDVLSLESRNLIKDVHPNAHCDKMRKLLTSKPSTFYAGFDPTAPSLHIGNLLILIFLMHCQRMGHSVVVVLGGATARLGDPSGKDKDRAVLSDGVIAADLENIRQSVENVFKNHSKLFADSSSSLRQHLEQSYTIVDNSQWYEGLNVLDFMTEVGRHVRLGRMLSKQMVRDRMQGYFALLHKNDDTVDTGKCSSVGLSLTEFLYQIFQANDWLHLYQREGVQFQVGGSDQLGNITSGYDLITRKQPITNDNEMPCGITLPLVVTEAGNKLGKTAGAPVWLSPQKTTPFEFYQYFVRLPDSQVETMLKMFTFLSLDEIASIMASQSKDKNVAQRRLAVELTRLVHGDSGLKAAVQTTQLMYGNPTTGKEGEVQLGSLSRQELSVLFSQASVVRIGLQAGMSMVDMAMAIGCFRTEADAVRIMTAGGFYVNQTRHANPDELVIFNNHVMSGSQMSVVRVGKRHYYIVDWIIT